MTRYIPFITSAILTCFLPASCRKDMDQATVNPGDETVTVSVRIDASSITKSGPLTKAENQTLAEKNIASMELWIFRTSDGLLEYRNRVNAASTISDIKLTLGEKRFMVIANASAAATAALTQPSHISSWYGPFADNARDALLTKGSIVQTVTTSTTSVAVSLKRFTSKVALSEAPVFSGAMTGATFDGMYLINVPKTYNETGSYAVTDETLLWNYRNKISSSPEQTAMLYADVWDKALYGYPNATAESVDGSEDFTTKLVLKVTKGGHTTWFPIGIPGMGTNKVYVVSGINITGTGSENPNDYVIKNSISYTVNVKPWQLASIQDLPSDDTWSVGQN